MSRSSNLSSDLETDTPFQTQQRRNVAAAMANINVRGKDIAPRFNPLEIFKDEKKRLDTFNTWPASAPVKKEDLARDGFIYLKVDDRTQCAFCRGVLSDWDVGDIVRDEHRRYCPECPFAFGYECGNIPLHPAPPHSLTHSTVVTVPVQGPNNYQHTIHIVPQNGDSSLGGRSIQESNRSDAQGELDRLPVLPNPSLQPSENTSPTATAKYPAWENEQLRLRSFKGWPPQMSQVPRDLANAGLVYLGTGDKCKCFWCGGELYEWEEEDEPWEEHAKWFPYCNYVRHTRGDAYIQYVQDKQNGVITEYPDDVFSLPHVLAVLREGYTRDEIQEALGRFGSSLVDARTIKQAIEQTRQERREFLARNNAQNRGIDIVPMAPAPAPQDDDITMGEPASGARQQQTTSQPSDSTSVKTVVAPSSGNTFRSIARGASNSTTESVTESGPEDLESIKLENMSLKDKTLCKICMDNPLQMTFLPCGHLSTCENCARSLKECPICRRTITDQVKTYLS